jgi:hypothetical protein
MQIVQCPHCSTELTNDGSLAGQVTACGVCGQVFQMPELVPEPPVEKEQPRHDLALDEPGPNGTPADENASSPLTPSGVSRRSRGSSGVRRASPQQQKAQFIWFTIFALGILPLTLTLIFAILLISRWASQPTQKPTERKPHPTFHRKK